MKTRTEAEKYLERFIPKNLGQKFPAEHGLKRTQLLLDLLQNPQEKYRCIHIAGTSGKGTTAFTTSLILSSAGVKTGLHLSPHLEDIRERMMINGSFISDKKFISYLNLVLKAVEKCEKDFDKPTYFEVLTALAFYTFMREKVEIAVIETGMGGTFDATNVIKRSDKIDVITRIGLDHTSILGKNLREISSQKAGIIQKRNTVITLDSKRTNEVFQKRAEDKNAQIFYLGKKNVQNIVESTSGIEFDFKFEGVHLPKLQISLLGKHQAENVGLALAAAFLAGTDITSPNVRTILKDLSFRGRLDAVKKNNKTIFIDGAHNEQKMRALISALKNIFPDQKFTVVLAIKKGKQVNEMLNLLKNISGALVITTFFKDTHDLVHVAYEQDYLAKKAKKLGFEHVTTAPTAKDALKVAMSFDNDKILATGSLYYLQDIYAELKVKS